VNPKRAYIFKIATRIFTERVFFSPSWALNRANDVMMRWNAFILKRTGSREAGTHGQQTQARLRETDRKRLGEIEAF